MILPLNFYAPNLLLNMWSLTYIICFSQTIPLNLGNHALHGKGNWNLNWQMISGNIYSRLLIKGSFNVSIQENNYKTLTRWYRTPTVVNKYNPSIPNTCWRCTREPCTLLHIWWSCPLNQPFWTQVHELVTLISTFSLEYTPAQFLLHHFNIPAHQYRKTLVLPLINVARLCIIVHWRSIQMLTIPEWFKWIGRIAEMEKLIFIAWDSPAKFSRTWASWTHFQTTARYSLLMG